MIMAYLKPEEIRKMNGDDRTKSLKDLRGELIHERGVAAMGGSPPSPGKIRQIRRQIARILTIQQEERLGIRDQKPKARTPGPKFVPAVETGQARSPPSRKQWKMFRDSPAGRAQAQAALAVKAKALPEEKARKTAAKTAARKP